MAGKNALGYLNESAAWAEAQIRFLFPIRNSPGKYWWEKPRSELRYYCKELRELRNQIRTLEAASGNAATAAER